MTARAAQAERRDDSPDSFFASDDGKEPRGTPSGGNPVAQQVRRRSSARQGTSDKMRGSRITLVESVAQKKKKGGEPQEGGRGYTFTSRRRPSYAKDP